MLGSESASNSGSPAFFNSFMRASSAASCWASSASRSCSESSSPPMWENVWLYYPFWILLTSFENRKEHQHSRICTNNTIYQRQTFHSKMLVGWGWSSCRSPLGCDNHLSLILATVLVVSLVLNRLRRWCDLELHRHLALKAPGIIVRGVRRLLVPTNGAIHWKLTPLPKLQIFLIAKPMNKPKAFKPVLCLGEFWKHLKVNPRHRFVVFTATSAQ